MGKSWAGTIVLFVVFIPFLIWYVLSRSKESAIALLVLTLILMGLHYYSTKDWEWYWHWPVLVMVACIIIALLNYTKIKHKPLIAAINTGIYVLLLLYIGLYEMPSKTLDAIQKIKIEAEGKINRNVFVAKGTIVDEVIENPKEVKIKDVIPKYDKEVMYRVIVYTKDGNKIIFPDPDKDHDVTLDGFLSLTVFEVWRIYCRDFVEYENEKTAYLSFTCYYNDILD